MSKPRILWILMYQGVDGKWEPSMDHFCAWSTKKSADWKIKQIRLNNYKAFKYEIARAK